MSSAESSRWDLGSESAEHPFPEDAIRRFSADRDEPDWMLRFRLESLARLRPLWGVVTSNLGSGVGPTRVPLPHRSRPHLESRARLPSEGAAAASERANRAVGKELEAQGVAFLDLDRAVHEFPDEVREAFGSLVASKDGPYAALNGAVWSGGTFLYVPAGVHVSMLLQPEMREDFRRTEPFERNLVIADADSSVEFLDGCAAPVLTSPALHASVVEVLVRERAFVRYTALQNWSPGVENHVAQCVRVHGGAAVEWFEANLGSRHTVKSPFFHLVGEGARADIANAAFAGPGQFQEIGVDVVHAAPGTRSTLDARVVVQAGGRAAYSPHVAASKGTGGVSSNSVWSGLLLDARSTCHVHPSMSLEGADATAAMRGSVDRIREDSLSEFTSRGMPRGDAFRRVVRGAFEPFTRRLPPEHAVEVERFVELRLDGAIG